MGATRASAFHFTVGLGLASPFLSASVRRATLPVPQVGAQHLSSDPFHTLFALFPLRAVPRGLALHHRAQLRILRDTRGQAPYIFLYGPNGSAPLQNGLRWRRMHRGFEAERCGVDGRQGAPRFIGDTCKY